MIKVSASVRSKEKLVKEQLEVKEVDEDEKEVDVEVKEVDVDEKEHCDGHAGADGPHDDAKAETRRGEDDARCFEF